MRKGNCRICSYGNAEELCDFTRVCDFLPTDAWTRKEKRKKEKGRGECPPDGVRPKRG